MTTRILTMVMLMLIVLLLFYTEHALTGRREPDPKELTGTLIPPLTVTTISGEELPLTILHRRNELLIFFSTDCDHCLNELQFWNSRRTRVSRAMDLRCISVNSVDETAEFLSEQGIELTAYTAHPDEVRKQFRISRVPTLIAVDNEGIIKACFSGTADKEFLSAKLSELFHEQIEFRDDK